MRIRNDMNPPTPWPPEMATGENPPDGAMLDYFVGPKFSRRADDGDRRQRRARWSRGFAATIRCRRSDPRYPDPEYWARKPPRVLLTTEGHHRFLWDLRYPGSAGDVHRSLG